MDAMPWLIDHSLCRQPVGVGTIEDRFPVVPMTTMVAFALEAAEKVGGGRVAIGLDEAVAFRWLPAAPPCRVQVTTEEIAPDVVRVRIGDNFRAEVRLAATYPPPPSAGNREIADAVTPPHTAREIYDGRWMFHGPQFQGIHTVQRFGSNALEATLVTLPPPGALLDAVGQLFGYWIEYSTPRDRLAFPYRIDRIDLYGPHPAPGEEVLAHVRIAALEKETVKGAFEIERADGTLWATVTNFTDRRFAGDHDALHKMYSLEEATVGSDRGDYWILQSDGGGADREMMMRRYLGGPERAVYADHSVRAQRPWLLGRIVMKDAVRDALWRRGHGPIFPIEVQTGNDEAGRPTAVHPGEADLRISIAHKGSVAVAIVAEGVDVGIDIEPVQPRSEVFDAMVMTDREHELGAALDPDRWRTRLWTAKEAVAKAIGTGLGGRPRDFEAVTLDGDWLRIGDHWVRSHTENLTEGEFIVSHTAQR
jgi:phosphopantetheinyl transferase (holo-ACP synthase)